MRFQVDVSVVVQGSLSGTLETAYVGCCHSLRISWNGVVLRDMFLSSNGFSTAIFS